MTTTFGAAVLVLFFFGVTLVVLAINLGDEPSRMRLILMYVLIGVMVLILFGVIALRIIKPAGLGGPPLPRTEESTFEDSRIAR